MQEEGWGRVSRGRDFGTHSTAVENGTGTGIGRQGTGSSGKGKGGRTGQDTHPAAPAAPAPPVLQSRAGATVHTRFALIG